MAKIKMNQSGWTTISEPDAEKHILGVSARSVAGEVVEVRIRHNDGEEKKGTVTKDGANALPMSLDDFKKDYLADALTIR